MSETKLTVQGHINIIIKVILSIKRSYLAYKGLIGV